MGARDGFPVGKHGGTVTTPPGLVLAPEEEVEVIGFNGRCDPASTPGKRAPVYRHKKTGRVVMTEPSLYRARPGQKIEIDETLDDMSRAAREGRGTPTDIFPARRGWAFVVLGPTETALANPALPMSRRPLISTRTAPLWQALSNSFRPVGDLQVTTNAIHLSRLGDGMWAWYCPDEDADDLFRTISTEARRCLAAALESGSDADMMGAAWWLQRAAASDLDVLLAAAGLLFGANGRKDDADSRVAAQGAENLFEYLRAQRERGAAKPP